MSKSRDDIEAYKAYVKKEIERLTPLFTAVALGDFDKQVPEDTDDDEFSQLHIGIQVMLDVFKNKIEELQKINEKLSRKISEKSTAFEETQLLAHIGSWQWYIEDDRMQWSAEMCRIFGLKVHQKNIDFNTFLNFVSSKERSFVQSTFEHALETHEPFEIFHQIELPDGEVKILQCRAEVILDEQGNPVKIIGTEQDMTAIKRTERELLSVKKDLSRKVSQRTARIGQVLVELKREMHEKQKAQYAAEQLAAIVESTNDAILSKKLDGTVTSWNKASEKLYGYRANEIMGKSVKIIIPDDKIEEHEEIMNRLKTGKKVNHFKTRRIKKNGELIYVDLTISPIRDKKGNIIAASSIAKDITENVRQEKLLKESQVRLSKFMNTVKDVFVILDCDMKILDLNKAALKLINTRSKKRYVGMELHEVFPMFYSKIRANAIKKVYKSHGTCNIEETIEDENGDFKHFSTDIFYMEDGFGIVSRDITKNVQYEFELNQSERKYRNLVETMNEGILMTDKKGIIQFANPTFKKQFGYAEKDLIGNNYTELLIDEPEQKKWKKLEKSGKGSSTQYELEMRTKTGQIKWMLINSSQVKDDANKVVGYVRLFTNITQRKLYEIDLDRLAKFASENPNPVLRYSDLTNSFVYSNKAAEVIISYFSENEATQTECINKIKEVYKKGKIFKSELDIGSRVFLFTIVPVNKGNYINLYGTDITQAKRAEEEVRRLLFVLAQTDNAIVIADHSGAIQWVNEAFVKTTGYELDEIKGTRGEKLRHGKRTGLDVEHPAFKEMLRTKQPISYESKNFTKAGKEYWSLTTLTPVLTEDGKIEGIVAVDTDVTDKKKAEKAILHAKRLAEVSSKAKERFLTNMSHEIRTPMNAIMGIIQLLQETKLDSEQKDYLKSMNFAGENLLHIINDILDLSKIESGKMNVENIPFDLKNMVTDLINSLRHRANEKQIDLLVHFSNDIPEKIVGDPVRINQILINLLGNALKFTDSGKVELFVDKVKTEKKNHVIQFKVKDTGIGIPDNLKNQIFKEFEQVQNKLSNSQGGTGLGLAIVKKIVHLLNGSIELESKKDEGSTFTIELPFKKYESKRKKHNFKKILKKNENCIKDKSVLLVEDNKLNQMIAEKFLTGMGLNVRLAENGKEAIENLKKTDFDLVLMDIRMPLMDGYQATSYIRNKMKSNVPIMAMTAHALNKEEKRCYDVGMNDYLTKPLKKDTLRKHIERIFNKG